MVPSDLLHQPLPAAALSTAETAPRSQTNPEVLRSRDAARYIGMSDSWLRISRMAGHAYGPPFHRIGTRAIRYYRADLDRWLETRRCTAGSPPHREANVSPALAASNDERRAAAPVRPGKTISPASSRNSAPSKRRCLTPRSIAQPPQQQRNPGRRC